MRAKMGLKGAVIRMKQSLFLAKKRERVRKVKKMSHFDQMIAYNAALRIISEKGQKTPSNKLSEYKKGIGSLHF